MNILCPIHRGVPMAYVSREPIIPTNKRASARLSKDESSEFNYRQPGYYKCPVAQCHRVHEIPYADVVVAEKVRLCPACKKLSDASESRRAYHDYQCNSCRAKKYKVYDAKRDSGHRKKDLAAGPKPRA